MRFITSIFMLLSATCGVISAYFVGHGIVSEHSWPWLAAAILVVAAVLFGFVFMRLARKDPQPAAHAEGHEPAGHPRTDTHPRPH